MNKLSSEHIVAVVRNRGKILWYRSPREFWIMDLEKCKKDFFDKGYHDPILDFDFRDGISIVDSETKDSFLRYMEKYEIDKNDLSKELANRYQSAESWWDVGDLFPIVFIDFDLERVGAFYPGGIPMERYAPSGWKGEFIDFSTEYPENIFPERDKFWIKKGCDLLKLLNERASKADG